MPTSKVIWTLISSRLGKLPIQGTVALRQSPIEDLLYLLPEYKQLHRIKENNILTDGGARSSLVFPSQHILVQGKGNGREEKATSTGYEGGAGLCRLSAGRGAAGRPGQSRCGRHRWPQKGLLKARKQKQKDKA